MAVTGSRQKLGMSGTTASCCAYCSTACSSAMTPAADILVPTTARRLPGRLAAAAYPPARLRQPLPDERDRNSQLAQWPALPRGGARAMGSQSRPRAVGEDGHQRLKQGGYESASEVRWGGGELWASRRRAAGGAARRYVVIGLLAAGLGLQNATVRRLAVPDVTTTVLTLTLTGLAADSWLAGGRADGRRGAGGRPPAAGGRRASSAGRGVGDRAGRGAASVRPLTAVRAGHAQLQVL